MDEPSTGLDPASRNSLWNVVRRAKQDRAIILTSKSLISLFSPKFICSYIGMALDQDGFSRFMVPFYYSFSLSK